MNTLPIIGISKECASIHTTGHCKCHHTVSLSDAAKWTADDGDDKGRSACGYVSVCRDGHDDPLSVCRRSSPPFSDTNSPPQGPLFTNVCSFLDDNVATPSVGLPSHQYYPLPSSTPPPSYSEVFHQKGKRVLTNTHTHILEIHVPQHT